MRTIGTYISAATYATARDYAALHELACMEDALEALVALGAKSEPRLEQAAKIAAQYRRDRADAMQRLREAQP